jgi:hypothetical protein
MEKDKIDIADIAIRRVRHVRCIRPPEGSVITGRTAEQFAHCCSEKITKEAIREWTFTDLPAAKLDGSGPQS